jgi:hypothetical protein
MILKRLKLANFKDILEREVQFPACGLIVVQGPNEVGKTALQEALDLLLEVPADSNKARVKTQRPVGRDAAPEVELEADCGPYSFTYFKRFDVRHPETVLRVHHPRSEQLTGRDAHERVGSILAENLDVQLWKAVRVQQGAAIGQVGLADCRSLMAALDAAAGTVPVGQGELTIFERIAKEALRYFTPGGQPVQDLMRDRKEVELLERDVARLTGSLAELQKTVEQVEWLDRQLRTLDEELEEAGSNRGARSDELRELEKLERELAPLHANAEAAEARASQAQDRRDARLRLVADVERLDDAVQALEVAHARRTAELENARSDAARQTLEAEAAAERREQAEQLYELRRRDYDFRQDELGLAQLNERHGRVVESRRLVSEARELLARTKITQSGLNRIDEERATLAKARAALEAGSPSLTFAAEAEITFLVDGDTLSLGPRQVVERAIKDELKVQVPNLFSMSVRSGASVESLTRQVHTSEVQLARIFKTSAVASRDDAGEQLRQRQEAERTVHDADARQQQDLRDLTLEQMSGKIESLERSTSSYLAARPAEPVIGATTEECDELRRRAEADAAQAKAVHEGASRLARGADERTDGLRADVQATSAQLDLQRENHERLLREIGVARLTATDDSLEQELREARDTEQETHGLLVAEEAQLQALEPERVRALAENATAACENLDIQRRALKEQRLRLEAELRFRGQDGLAEAYEEVASKRDRCRRALDGLEKRAGATKHLLEAMRECREEARQRREGPLRERINELGRILYGGSFSVELDDRLAISDRTLGGTTLAFEQLSTGAQEQLALIARLSAGMLVSDHGGVPIILDDTLGHSDEGRLEYMGHILSEAGRRCQVIVLTSYPRRYAHVSGATVISLVGDKITGSVTGSGAREPGAALDS